jgi:hypothetical protein
MRFEGRSRKLVRVTAVINIDPCGWAFAPDDFRRAERKFFFILS